PSIAWDFFLSYSGDDRFDQNVMVAAVFVFLSALGYKVWYDEHALERCGDPNNLQQIETGLFRCKTIICMVTKSYLSKKWPQLEFCTAYYHKKPKVYPVFCAADSDIDWKDAGWLYSDPCIAEDDKKSAVVVKPRVGGLIRAHSGQKFQIDRSQRVIELALALRKDNLLIDISNTKLSPLLSDDDPFGKKKEHMRSMFDLIIGECIGAFYKNYWSQEFLLRLLSLMRKVAFTICDPEHIGFNAFQLYHKWMHTGSGYSTPAVPPRHGFPLSDYKYSPIFSSSESLSPSSSSSSSSTTSGKWRKMSCSQVCEWIRSLDGGDPFEKIAKHWEENQLTGKMFAYANNILSELQLNQVCKRAFLDDLQESFPDIQFKPA
ncbi:MAG: toll/interleukin-1 receptor domain-containing protein, partial [Propionibacteriaceae bacterium]|nr:toll/interleukin-1 receptor domain-containing protein [Propionibacteriaceae bacterium]